VGSAFDALEGSRNESRSYKGSPESPWLDEARL